MKIAYIILLYLVCCVPLKSQIIDKAAASVGDENISAEEFKMRYELMPHLDEDPFLTDSMKYHFLYTLIAEKLWAKEAERLGIDTDSYTKNIMSPLRNLYLRDALFKEEIENKIQIIPEEIVKAELKNSIILKFNTISSLDSAEIYNVYSELINGASFDSLLKQRPESVNQQTPLQGSFGQFEEEAVEDSLYSLKTGNFSSPVKTEYAWFIFKMSDKIKKGSSLDQSVNNIKRILKERKTKKLGMEYFKKLLSGVQASIDSSLFYNIAGKFYSFLNEKKTLENIPDTSLIYFDETGISSLIKEVGNDTLQMDLVHSSQISVTVKDFLYNLLIDLFYVKSTSKANISYQLNRALKNFIQEKYLDKEAVKRGLQNSPEVKEALKIWRESYLAQILKNRFIDSVKVSEKEVDQYLAKNYSKDLPITEVNIVEILNDKLEVVELVLDQLKNGADIRDLAKLYTQREWTKNSGGEFGFFPATMYGEIGSAAGKMNIGEVYGPIQTSEGYSIFKLIGKKEIDSSSNEILEQYRDHVLNQLKEEKLDSLLEFNTIQFAKKYGIKINRETVNSLKLTNINMFTYRFMGFGGKIAAVPYTPSFYEWMEKWYKQNRSLP